jgi:hypothetical protein
MTMWMVAFRSEATAGKISDAYETIGVAGDESFLKLCNKNDASKAHVDPGR